MKIYSAIKCFIAGLLVTQVTHSSVLNGEYRLISTDGVSWDEVTSIPSNLTFEFRATTYSPSGNQNWSWLDGTDVTLFYGDCINSACQASKRLYDGVIVSGSNGINTVISGLPVTTVYGPSGFISLSDLSQACASQAGGPDGIYDSHTFDRDITFTAHVRGNHLISGPIMGGNPIEKYIDKKEKIDVNATIHCESFGPNPGEINAEELKVFLATNASATTQPSVGVECPQTRATVRIKANRAGTLPVKVQTRVGTSPAVSKQKDIQVTLQGDGSFTGWYEEWISVSQTSVVSLKAVEVDNPYVFNDVNLETQWEDISLVCSGSGGAGLTVNTGQSGSGGSSTPRVNPNVNGGNTLIMNPDHTGGGPPTAVQANPQRLPKTPTTNQPTTKIQAGKTQSKSNHSNKASKSKVKDNQK